ncbi:hypothetical protein RRG08_054989 [Elysia crispata]|uniref:Uncharacterized protein n=1 Tax=Elysia crispata TaxID=231223 RepID=A0AAE0XRM0_9GAST|nr:hypothetical protein RRG08_054989 [Elysia crispata]
MFKGTVRKIVLVVNETSAEHSSSNPRPVTFSRHCLRSEQEPGATDMDRRRSEFKKKNGGEGREGNLRGDLVVLRIPRGLQREETTKAGAINPWRRESSPEIFAAATGAPPTDRCTRQDNHPLEYSALPGLSDDFPSRDVDRGQKS